MASEKEALIQKALQTCRTAGLVYDTGRGWSVCPLVSLDASGNRYDGGHSLGDPAADPFKEAILAFERDLSLNSALRLRSLCQSGLVHNLVHRRTLDHPGEGIVESDGLHMAWEERMRQLAASANDIIKLRLEEQEHTCDMRMPYFYHTWSLKRALMEKCREYPDQPFDISLGTVASVGYSPAYKRALYTECLKPMRDIQHAAAIVDYAAELWGDSTTADRREIISYYAPQKGDEAKKINTRISRYAVLDRLEAALDFIITQIETRGAQAEPDPVLREIIHDSAKQWQTWVEEVARPSLPPRQPGVML